MKIIPCEQGSPEWHEARKGRITASNIKLIMNGQRSTWFRYMEQLRGEGGRYRGNYAMDRGKRLEKAAVSRYELQYPELDVQTIGFAVHDYYDFLGASPDALVGMDGGVEVKCPLNHQKHLDCFTLGMHQDHMPQVQANIWICERSWWDFISFDPRTEDVSKRLYVQRIPRDERYIADMELKVKQFWLMFQNGEKAAVVPETPPQFF